MTDQDTTDNGKITKEKGLEETFGKTGVSISDPGLKTNSMVWEFIYTKMEYASKDSFSTIKKRVTDCIFGRTDALTMAGGTGENSMAWEFSKTLKKRKRSGVFGRMASA